MSKKLAKKILVIGWDAADWKVMMPLIEQGKMPTLAKFISELKISDEHKRTLLNLTPKSYTGLSSKLVDLI